MSAHTALGDCSMADIHDHSEVMHGMSTRIFLKFTIRLKALNLFVLAMRRHIIMCWNATFSCRLDLDPALCSLTMCSCVMSKKSMIFQITPLN